MSILEAAPPSRSYLPATSCREDDQLWESVTKSDLARLTIAQTETLKYEDEKKKSLSLNLQFFRRDFQKLLS